MSHPEDRDFMILDGLVRDDRTEVLLESEASLYVKIYMYMHQVCKTYGTQCTNINGMCAHLVDIKLS